MQHWEYLVVFVTDSTVAQAQKDFDVHLDADAFTEKLNRYGSAGWELVSFEWEKDGARAAFKRPKAAAQIQEDD